MVQLTVSTGLKSSPDDTLDAMSEEEKLATVIVESERAEHERGSGKWDVVVPNPKARKRPRLCFFVTSLILLMVAAVVLVLVIKISLSSRKESCCLNANETTNENDEAEKMNSEKEQSLKMDISWEMKRAFLELRQIMGDFKPKVLFPVYRKDLPYDYIAYYEVKLEHKDGVSYAVISAGEETGDYSLVETGGIPSPLDKLRDKAYLNGHYCSKFFRLTTDGVTICEDHRLNRVVATTGDIYPKSPITNWQQLDDQVTRALPQLKSDWKRMAKVANKIKEWKISGKSTINDETSSGQDVTERGLYPGEFTEIPVENVTEVQIKFVGLTRHETREKAVNISLREWQTRLCQVLNNICDPKNPTNIRQDVAMLTFAGSKYLKFGVNADENYVKTTLKDEEVRFQVELNMDDGKRIMMHYGIVLAGKRLGRSVEVLNYEIPNEHLFPSIHSDRNYCLSARTMLLSWAMIFSYYDNLARAKPELGYRRLGFSKNRLGERLSTLKEKHNYIASVLVSKIDMKCAPFVRESKSWDKTKLEHWFQQKNGRNSKIVYVAGLHRRPKATRKATNLIKKGIPAIISIEHEFTTSPRYGVVTRMRQQRSSYRRCGHARCSFWEEVALTEFFVRDGRTNGKWQTACTYYVAGAVKQ